MGQIRNTNIGEEFIFNLNNKILNSRPHRECHALRIENRQIPEIEHTIQ